MLPLHLSLKCVLKHTRFTPISEFLYSEEMNYHIISVGLCIGFLDANHRYTTPAFC